MARRSPTVPAGLATRGAALWRSLNESRPLNGAEQVLAAEACRVADRLEKLDALLRCDIDVWARLVHDLRTEDYELRIDAALAEAREQQGALRQLVLALKIPQLESEKKRESKLDQLAALRAARDAAAGGVDPAAAVVVPTARPRR